MPALSSDLRRGEALALPIALAFFCLGYVLQRVLVNRFVGRPEHEQFILLVGLAIIIVNALLLTFGERPNSPTATTSVLSSRPRWARSSINADAALSKTGQRQFFSIGKLLRCVSQEPSGPGAGSVSEPAGQVTCTKRVPASISRRAKRHDWPKRVRP